MVSRTEERYTHDTGGRYVIFNAGGFSLLVAVSKHKCTFLVFTSLQNPIVIVTIYILNFLIYKMAVNRPYLVHYYFN